MTCFAQRPLFIALAATLALATVAPAAAQQQSGTPTMREQRAKRQAANDANTAKSRLHAVLPP